MDDMESTAHELSRDIYHRSDFGDDSVSNCCGAPFVQGDLCSDCGEHASPLQSENDMMVSNLKNMKQDADKILSMDKEELNKKLKGHDWAADHISTSTDDAEEVADFLTTEDNPCWDGYEKVKGKKDYEKGSCKKINEDVLKESEKNSTFVDKTKLVENLRLMDKAEPMVEPKPATKPAIKPAKPMREADRPFMPKRKTKPAPKAETNEGETGTDNE
jgi:hypothetical protein